MCRYEALFFLHADAEPRGVPPPPALGAISNTRTSGPAALPKPTRSTGRRVPLPRPAHNKLQGKGHLLHTGRDDGARKPPRLRRAPRVRFRPAPLSRFRAPAFPPSPRRAVPPWAPHTHPGCGAAGGGRRRGRKRPKGASGCGRDPETSWRGPPSRSGRREEERGAERPLPASAAGARASGLRRVAVPPPAPSSPPTPTRARQDRAPAPGGGGGEAECGCGALWRATVDPPR